MVCMMLEPFALNTKKLPLCLRISFFEEPASRFHHFARDSPAANRSRLGLDAWPASGRWHAARQPERMRQPLGCLKAAEQQKPGFGHLQTCFLDEKPWSFMFFW